MDQQYKYTTDYKTKTPKDEINKKFMIWMDKIEEYIFTNIGMYLLDFPDEEYMYYFENNVSYEYVGDKIISDYYFTV
jgi:hypothetical protein